MSNGILDLIANKLFIVSNISKTQGVSGNITNLIYNDT